MLSAAMRDLVWRRKRFLIALAATSLVLAMTLVMSGLAAAFPNEVDRLQRALGAEVYYAKQGANGPFSAGSVVRSDLAPPGTSPVLSSVAALEVHGELRQVSIFGVAPGELGSPLPDRGAALAGRGEAVVSSTLDMDVGEVVQVGGASVRIVGELDDLTLFGGQATVFVPIVDAQALIADGQPVASFFVGDGPVADVAGLASFSRSVARDDLLRPLEGATGSISFVKLLLWIVAAAIVGSVVFLSALERTRDFAVFKATGVATASIGVGLVAQAVMLAGTASVVAIGVAAALAPAFPMPVEIPTRSMLFLPLVAVGVGALASLIGLRRAVGVPPALAFGGAS